MFIDLIGPCVEESPLIKIDLEPSALNLALFSWPINTRINGSLAAIALNGEKKNIATKIMAHPEILLGDVLTIKIEFRY